MVRILTTAIHIFLIFILRHIFIIYETFVVFHAILVQHLLCTDLVPAVSRALDYDAGIIDFFRGFLLLKTLLMLEVSSFDFFQTLLTHLFLILLEFASKPTWSYILELRKSTLLLLLTQITTSADNRAHTRRL